MANKKRRSHKENNKTKENLVKYAYLEIINPKRRLNFVGHMIRMAG